MFRSGQETAAPIPHVSIRAMVRQLVPGLILPGAIYFVVARQTSVLAGLAAGSSVRLLDALCRVVRRKRPSPLGLVFVAMAVISIGLALLLRSPIFILARGAALSGSLGLAFAVSAALRRPLTRTIAIL